VRRKLGLQPDTKHRSSSLPNRPRREDLLSWKVNGRRKNVQVEPTESVGTIAAPRPQVEPRPADSCSSTGHDTSIDASQRAKLQDKIEGRPVLDDIAVNSTAHRSDYEEDDGNVGSNEAAIGTREPEDFWALAEEQLRKRGSHQCKIMDKFDRVLQKPKNLGSTLEPPNTNARRIQINAFLESRFKKLENAEDENRLGRCKENAKRYLKIAVKSLTATQGIINKATAPCLPAGIACVGVTLLLTVSLFIQYQKAE
jgi:hypothetical protein